MNRVYLLGNLGERPKAGAGKASDVVTFSLATSHTWTDARGEDQAETDWHRVTVFGAQGRACVQHLSKGDRVLVEGRVRVRNYETKDGEKRTGVDVVATIVHFLQGRKVGDE